MEKFYKFVIDWRGALFKEETGDLKPEIFGGVME